MKQNVSSFVNNMLTLPVGQVEIAPSTSAEDTVLMYVPVNMNSQSK